ncbi:MAG: hypothetical protein F7C38_05800 [Desulfurococcales archaeon]|nr:hypothetical protein [Desulfurococcales archaeon]
MTKINLKPVLLLAILVLLPIAQALIASTTVNETASLGASHSTITYQLQATTEKPTNATGSFTLTLQGDSNSGTMSLAGDSNIDYVNENMSDLYIRLNLQGSYSSERFSTSFDLDFYTNLSNTMNMTPSPSLIAPLTAELPYLQVAMPAYILQNPMNPMGGQPGMPGMPSMEVSVNATGTTTGVFNGTHGVFQTNVDGVFNLVNGAMILVGMPGDLKGNFTLYQMQVVTNTSSTTDTMMNVTFNSGNTTIDQQAAYNLYNILSMMKSMLEANNQTSTSIDVTYSGGTSVGVHIHSETSTTAPPTTPIAGNYTVQPNITANAIPLFYENATGSFTYHLLLTGSSSTKTLHAEDTIQANVEGINPDALSFYPTNINVNGQITNNGLSANINIEGDGDPSVAYDIAATLLYPFMDEGLCSKTSLTADFSTDGSIHFYNTETGEDLGTQLHITCQNLEDLEHITVGEPGLSVRKVASGETIVEGSGETVNLSYPIFQGSKVVEVHGKGFSVKTGRIALASSKVFVVKAGSREVVFKTHGNTVIDGALKLKVLDETEASQLAASHGYTAAGVGVSVEGIEKGKADITLPVESTNVAILELHDDGTATLITNVNVNPDGTVTFRASSFSTFIPVALGGSGGGATTTSTASQTQTSTGTQTTTTSSPGTTTSTSQTTTTKEESPGPTIAPGTTTTTTTKPSPTGSKTTATGTTETTSTSTQEESQEQASSITTQGGGGEQGSGNTALMAAAIIVIIVVGAAAALALKR